MDLNPPTSVDARIKAEIQRRYDRFSEREFRGQGTYEEVSPAKAYFRSRKLQAALELGAFPPGSHLLEIGCSVGQFSLPLARRGYRMTGIDLSPHSVEVAKRRARQEGLDRASFFIDDAESLDLFPSNAFDGAVSFSTFRYLPRVDRALRSARRVLKPGGRLVADFPNRWCPWFYLKQVLGSEPHPHDHWFTEPQLLSLLAQSGFQNSRARSFLFTPTVAPASWLWLFKGIDRIAEPIPGIRRMAGIWIVSAEKP